MEMIERYVYAVTQRLPEKARTDVEMELRGLIEDLLEERVQGKTVSKADINSVLIELGNPRDLAKEYGGEPRYLIGPGLFDSYLDVLKIVGSVILTVVGVALVIKAFVTPQDIVTFIIGFLGSLIGVAFQVFVWVTLSFAAAEYFTKDDRESMPQQEWTPEDLKEIPDHTRQIPVREPLAEAGLSIFFLALYLMPQRLGVVQITPDAVTTVIPVVNTSMVRHFLPLVVAFVGITVVREAWKLVQRKWSGQLAVVSLVCNLIAIVLAYFIFANPAFWNPNFVDQLLGAGVGEVARVLKSIWPIFTVQFVRVIIVAYVFDTIRAFYRAFKSSMPR